MASEAFEAGYHAGQDSGGWVIDGNTPIAHVRAILKGIDEGDPMVLDMQPAPLSGEWSGESIPELSDIYGIDLSDDDNADDFEQGFSEGYWHEVERAARYLTTEDE